MIIMVIMMTRTMVVVPTLRLRCVIVDATHRSSHSHLRDLWGPWSPLTETFLQTQDHLYKELVTFLGQQLAALLFLLATPHFE